MPGSNSTLCQVIHGDCLDVLPTLLDASVDAVITDPPYPHIKRDYGYWTTEEWWALIVEGVIPEVRRILKPTGSAVFILQPNSEHVGQMRGWLWEFMAWVCREWNMVQDVWWWNYQALPTQGATTGGLLRTSIKPCVWCGLPNCYRNQGAVLWTPSDASLARIKSDRASGRAGERRGSPSGQTVHTMQRWHGIISRGGSTPFNLLPIQTDGFRRGKKRYRHGAVTPLAVADWWTRYIVPPGGTVLDPFCGSGTMGIAALQNGCNFIGIEKEARYCEIAKKRLAQTQIGLGI